MKPMTEAQAWEYLAVVADTEDEFYICWAIEPSYRKYGPFHGPYQRKIGATLAAKMLKRMTAHRGRHPAPGMGGRGWWPERSPLRVRFCRRMAKLAAKEGEK